MQQTNVLMEQARKMAKEKTKPNIALFILLVIAGIIIGALAVFLMQR